MKIHLFGLYFMLFYAVHPYLIHIINSAYIVTINGSSYIKCNKGQFDIVLVELIG